MRTVPVSGGREALVDDEDYPLVAGLAWTYTRGYAVHNFSGKNLRMHQVLMPCPRGMHRDHINGDGLDNRRCNLRIATPAQNHANARLSRRNTTGFKGVCWHKAARKWMASIGFNKKLVYLGLFETPEEAHAAYCEAATKFFGEFARAQ